MKEYRSGLDNLLESKLKSLSGKRLGLVTNHTGVTKDLESNVDILFRNKDVTLTALFAPEHGVRGSVQAGGEVKDSVDPITQLPVYSLYGDNQKPTPEMLEDIDVLVYDIQDVGVRYYTYVSTLFYCLEACAENNVPFVVLDRLNPIGRRIEGNVLEPGFESFVGAYPLPQRHGMTVGELALWANGEFDIKANLQIVEVTGWNGEYADQLALPWVPPSPNIPSFTSSVVYPITCLFEGTNLSEGRGTANPFEYVGAPWINPQELVEHLNSQDLKGVVFRPIYFVPTFSKHQGVECGGVQVVVTDREQVNSCLTGLTLLKAIRELYPRETGWRQGRAEGRAHMAFDLLMGTDKVRHALEAGQDIKSLVDEWNNDIDEFTTVREKYLLY